jgi:hypothetical protein
MIDRSARSALSRALRRLVSGRVTNDQYEDQLLREVRSSRDAGVRAIREAAWMLYDDLREHRLESPYALGRVGRRHVARWVLFLKSSDEYQWPDVPTWLRLVLLVPNIVTFGLVEEALRRWRDGRGDAEVWPFMRRRDLDRAVEEWPGSGQPAAAADGSSPRR